MYPSELKIIVYAARNLQSKRKGAVCQASVIFGVGKEKFRTEVMKENDPTWNEESVINVNTQNASLVLTVMDREDALGNISVPVNQLPSAAHKRRWLPLKRKGQQTSSDLCFDCWVTKFRKDNILAKFMTLTTGAPSPQEKRRESVISASTGIKGSTSSLDICSKSLEDDRRESIKDESSSKGLSSSGRTNSITNLNVGSPAPRPSFAEQRAIGPKLQPTLGAVMSMRGPPEITGISPRFGPSSGGTKVIIRGCNLGRDKEDFLGFFICSSDCLDTLEYHSRAKLVCVTKPWHGTKPNPGPIVLVTKSGGRGVSTIQFEFQGEPIRKKKDNSAGKEKDKKKNDKKNSFEANPDDELLGDIAKLRQSVQDLTSENQSLRSYIDKLMILLMEKFPEALEATSSIPLSKK